MQKSSLHNPNNFIELFHNQGDDKAADVQD